MVCSWPRANARLTRHGENRLTEKPPRSKRLAFADQFKSLLILVPIGAAVLAGPSAHAAGVMIADDAGIVDAKACLVETLMNVRRDSI